MHNPFENLKDTQFSDREGQLSEQEKTSKKAIDITVRKLFESNPKLRERIVNVMGDLCASSEALPLIHITADTIILQDGSERDSTMVQRIEGQGFRGRHTNVGAFVVRKDQTRLAEPKDYEKYPEDFLKSLITLLKRYWHHGSRTNKDIYAEQRDQGRGVPIMLLLQGDLPLERGTDYDDHYILKEDVSSDVILGNIRLETENGVNNDMILRTANDLLEIIDSHAIKEFEVNEAA